MGPKRWSTGRQTTLTSAPTSENQTKSCRGSDRMVHENAKVGQGRRRNDRERSAGISPGWTWVWVLIWIVIAFHVGTLQQWDSTLGFPGEGPNKAPEGWRRTSAPVDGTCLFGKPHFRRTTGYLHEAGFFACRETLHKPHSAADAALARQH